ncbi:putative proton-dependent oligopeptide transporter family, MFS transporter superfamily [Helianthus annuus]|nr:putative proton-dependent oligopeptide transporter family, MFS transporter superfamily [Helianthus annuus]
MGADQFDDFEPKERAHKLTFFNWWVFSIFLAHFSQIHSWCTFKIPWIGAFVFGTPVYRHKPRVESPFTRMAKVLVAAARKWNTSVPVDSKELYELTFDHYASPGKYRIDHSSSLRFLDKAAVRVEEPASEWYLCPVTQVEQTKQMVKMIPVLCATFIPSTLIA